MEPLLTIRVIWQDEDMVEIDVLACTADFAGRTQVYTTYDDLSHFAAALSGFPRAASHTVELKAGEPDSYSYFGVRFYCFDAAGHAALHAVLESNVATQYRAQEKSKTQLEVQFESMQVDRFISQLTAMIKAKEGQATLLGVPPYTQNINTHAL